MSPEDVARVAADAVETGALDPEAVLVAVAKALLAKRPSKLLALVSMAPSNGDIDDLFWRLERRAHR